MAGEVIERHVEEQYQRIQRLSENIRSHVARKLIERLSVDYPPTEQPHHETQRSLSLSRIRSTQYCSTTVQDKLPSFVQAVQNTVVSSAAEKIQHKILPTFIPASFETVQNKSVSTTIGEIQDKFPSTEVPVFIETRQNKDVSSFIEALRIQLPLVTQFYTKEKLLPLVQAQGRTRNFLLSLIKEADRGSKEADHVRKTLSFFAHLELLEQYKEYAGTTTGSKMKAFTRDYIATRKELRGTKPQHIYYILRLAVKFARMEKNRKGTGLLSIHAKTKFVQISLNDITAASKRLESCQQAEKALAILDEQIERAREEFSRVVTKRSGSHSPIPEGQNKSTVTRTSLCRTVQDTIPNMPNNTSMDMLNSVDNIRDVDIDNTDMDMLEFVNNTDMHFAAPYTTNMDSVTNPFSSNIGPYNSNMDLFNSALDS